MTFLDCILQSVSLLYEYWVLFWKICKVVGLLQFEIGDNLVSESTRASV